MYTFHWKQQQQQQLFVADHHYSSYIFFNVNSSVELRIIENIELKYES